MKTLSLLVFSLIIGGALRASNSDSVRNTLLREADFVVGVIGVHIEKFDLGLSDYDPESRRLRKIRIPREGAVEFFANQKRKKCVLVRYQIVDIEDWESEIDRTVRYFKSAGYSRVVLLQEYGIIQGITVIFDSSGIYSKQQFIASKATE